MAEEHRCQAPPEGPRLCANNCGFFDIPATLGLCSKCYRDRQLKEEQEAKMAVEKSFLASASDEAPGQAPSDSAPAVVPLLPLKREPCLPPLTEPSAPPAAPSAPTAAAAAAAAAAVQPGRCTSCRKRVGLTGFRCRCGQTYCGSHRYPEKHGCTFDFKSAGREAVARANPVVKADKLNRI